MSNLFPESLRAMLTRGSGGDSAVNCVSHTRPDRSNTHTPIREAKVQFPKRPQPVQEHAIEKYIPKRAMNDPVKLGSQTVHAVDIIGQMAVSNVEGVISEIEKGSEEVCNELRTLADSIRVGTIEASSRIAVYCDRVNGLVAGIRHVQDILQPQQERVVGNEVVQGVEEELDRKVDQMNKGD